MPFIPESPSRRTSFKLGKDGNVSMEQEDIKNTDDKKDDDPLSKDNGVNKNSAALHGSTNPQDIAPHD